MKGTEVILLLSGGIDSTTLLAELKMKGCKVHALSFDYGQRHIVELDFARANADKYDVYKLTVIKLDLGAIATHSILTNQQIPAVDYHETPISNNRNPSYVPGRNLMMISHAAAYAEAHGIKDIYFGSNADDGRFFPDCQTEFVKAINKVWQNCDNTAGIKVHTPFINMSKVEVIEHGLHLAVDLTQTLSCYSPIGYEECGTCMSCLLKQEVMKEILIKRNVK